MKPPLIITLTVLLRELPVLQAVCRRRGWEFRAGQRVYRWFGRRLDERPLPPGTTPADLGRCAHAIAVPGCLYEVGLVWRRGHYLPVWDDGPEGGLDAALGPGGGVLWQAYGTECARRAAFRRGHRFGRHIDYAGTLRLRVHTEDRVAHVRVSREGETTLWIFNGADQPTFRYLADALGRARSETLALLEPADHEPSLGPLAEIRHDPAVVERTPVAVGSDRPSELPAPAAQPAGGGTAGALSPV